MMHMHMQVLLDQVTSAPHRSPNIPRKLTDVRKRLTTFVKAVTRHRRTVASHLLVIMISPEDRSSKPYALPVQCIPYSGMPEARIRDIVTKLVKEMQNRGMRVAGMLPKTAHAHAHQICELYVCAHNNFVIVIIYNIYRKA